MERSTGLTLALMMAVLVYCEAHGGSLHDASHPNYSIKYVAGSCDDWQAPVAASKLATNGRRLAATAYSVDGLVRMMVRINANCSGDYTTSTLINVTISEGSAPAAGVLVNGSVNTGSCSTPGAGDVYMLNATKGMDDHNLLFFKPNATSAKGVLVGSFANDGVVDTAGPDSAKSFVLYVKGAPISCCNLKISTPAGGYAAYLDARGLKNCTLDDGHSAHSANTSAPLGMTTGGKWKACDKINGTYQYPMQSEAGAKWVLCLQYQNGTMVPEPLGMTMGGVWMECTLVNGVYQMDHGSGDYAKCTEYRNGTKVSASATTPAGTTGATNTTESSAAAGRGAASLLVRCAVGLLGLGLLLW